MSKRHQASRRRTYGRRQHEIRERGDRDGRVVDAERDAAEDGFAPHENTTVSFRMPAFGATWLGLD